MLRKTFLKIAALSNKLKLPKAEVFDKWNLLRQQSRNNKLKIKNICQAGVEHKAPKAFNNALLKPILNMNSDGRTSSSQSTKEHKASLKQFWTMNKAEDDLVPMSSSPSGRRGALINHKYDCLTYERKDDDLELWGQSVAATLRTYPDVNAVRMAKSKMNKVMADLEAGELDVQSTTR